MTDKRYILYGAGRFGMLALKKYGKDQVAYFCDSNSEAAEIEGIPVIRPEKLKALYAREPVYQVVITPGNYGARDEIKAILGESKIPYEVFERMDPHAGGSKVIRICGNARELECIYESDAVKGFERRIPLTFGLFQKAVAAHAEDFQGKQIDLSVYIGDHSLDAYHSLDASRGMDAYHSPDASRGMNAYQTMDADHSRETADYILAYNTVYAGADRVIPIPDYRTYFDPENYVFAETPEACREAADRAWTDPRILWRGNLTSDDSRGWLQILAQKYPDILLVDDPVNCPELGFEPMTGFARHKYLLDIRGYGWSDRLKILLQLGRPIFLVDRPFQEWYTNRLIPEEHYIPVREDLSDLVEKYRDMEGRPERYGEIVRNMARFVRDNFTPEAVLGYVRDIILRYGIV